MKTLGVASAHDSSVCVYEDGKIISFYKEERITRKKRDSWPVRSLEMSSEFLKNKNIDAFAFCSVVDTHLFDTYKKLSDKYFNISEYYDFSENHHLQHASLAFYNSGFKEAAVIVIDRNGSIFLNSARESETIFYCSYPCNFIPVYKNLWVYDNSIYDYMQHFDYDYEIDASSMYGIVKVYESATSLIRQNPLENGKTMGLAAYGEKQNYHSLFFNKTNIPVDAVFQHENFTGNRECANKDLMHLSTKEITKDNYKIYADYAFHVQQETQQAASFLIQKAIEKTGTKNVIITGGYGLNVVANHYYIEKFPEINFYFEPIADDTGNSIGGAMLIYRDLTKDESIYERSDTFIHGKQHDLSDINGKNISVADVAKLLVNEKSVAIFEGLAEGGPRALGHRSILFYPKNKNSKKIVNRIKKREWYRPFAAAILEEDCEKYFYMGNIKSSPYMTISFPAKDFTKNNFPGIVHVDGSCRIQTVSKSNKTFYKLLMEIKNITGHGILLNTSFNLAGEPLVDTPKDAIETLNNSELDYLWFPEVEKILE